MTSIINFYLLLLIIVIQAIAISYLLASTHQQSLTFTKSKVEQIIKTHDIPLSFNVNINENGVASAFDNEQECNRIQHQFYEFLNKYHLRMNSSNCLNELFDSSEKYNIIIANYLSNIDAIFTVHDISSDDMAERSLNIIKQFAKMKSSWNIVTSFGKYHMDYLQSSNLLSCFDGGWRYRTEGFDWYRRILSEDSLTLKHYQIYWNMLTTVNPKSNKLILNNVLITEDDFMFENSNYIRQHLNQIVNQSPKECEIIFIDTVDEMIFNEYTNNEFIKFYYYFQNKKEEYDFLPGRIGSPAYIINLQGALKMMKSLPIMSPIDIQMFQAATGRVMRWNEHFKSAIKKANEQNTENIHFHSAYIPQNLSICFASPPLAFHQQFQKTQRSVKTT